MAGRTEIGNPLPDPWQPGDMVLVLWRDCQIIEGFRTAKATEPYMEMWSCGFLMRDDADGVVIGTDHSNDGTDDRFRYVNSFPRSQVIEMYRLSRYWEKDDDARG